MYVGCCPMCAVLVSMTQCAIVPFLDETRLGHLVIETSTAHIGQQPTYIGPVGTGTDSGTIRGERKKGGAQTRRPFFVLAKLL